MVNHDEYRNGAPLFWDGWMMMVGLKSAVGFLKNPERLSGAPGRRRWTGVTISRGLPTTMGMFADENGALTSRKDTHTHRDTQGGAKLMNWRSLRAG